MNIELTAGQLAYLLEIVDSEIAQGSSSAKIIKQRLLEAQHILLSKPSVVSPSEHTFESRLDEMIRLQKKLVNITICNFTHKDDVITEDFCKFTESQFES